MKIELGKGLCLKLCPYIHTVFAPVYHRAPRSGRVRDMFTSDTCLVTTSRRGLQLGLRYRYMVDYVYDFDYMISMSLRPYDHVYDFARHMQRWEEYANLDLNSRSS